MTMWGGRFGERMDPQAWVLTPGNVLAIARAIVSAPDHYQAGVAAARRYASPAFG